MTPTWNASCKVVAVKTPSRTYKVLTGTGLLSHVGELSRDVLGGERVLAVSDTNVWPLYGKTLTASFEAAGKRVTPFVFEAGEARKNLDTLGQCLETMAEAGLTRDDGVVCLGGGVAGDLGGLAAALYMRGTRVVQVPTSLLAMVDSSVGGKTAVDLPGGKNLCGAFFQPSLVVADATTLKTLSPEQLRDSAGEVVKTAILAGQPLFDVVLRHPLGAWLKAGGKGALDVEPLPSLVSDCIALKRDVVEADEREVGLRQTLNLGHTIGHAIEAASDYRLGHGTCVAIGLAAIAKGGAALGYTPRHVADEVLGCLSAWGLPTTTDIELGRVLAFAGADKKRHGSEVNVIVIEDLGHVGVRPMDYDRFGELVSVGLSA